jgi:hypothetical protein
MPLVQIKGISGYLSLQQKQEIISKVTDAIVSATAPALLSIAVPDAILPPPSLGSYLLHPCSRP